MNVLLAASEVVGFAKTGGLADVAGSLPRALARRGHNAAVILPLYRITRNGPVPLTPTGHRFAVTVGNRIVFGALWRATLPDSDVPAYLIEQADYFERDEDKQGRGLYQFTLPGGQRRDYPDNAERYTFFCRAVLEALPLLDAWPDVLHVNDWQTGLIPVYLREVYQQQAVPALAEKHRQVRTLMTIHNLAFQGLFGHGDMAQTGLSWSLFNHRQLEFYGQLNFLKAGIVFADLLNTVSPTYAREIQTAELGHGLEGVLAERRDRLFGIVNGVDYAEWDPAIDRHLAVNYTADDARANKPMCKAALQARLELPADPGAPLLGVVARLDPQKGVELILQAADGFVRQGAQLAVVGTGEPEYERQLQKLQGRHPKHVRVTLRFDDPLAHQVEAGADLFLMPSKYEPCGLNQMYSLKYGAVPVVRATGGLADTITDATPESIAAGTATGFSFGPFDADALYEAVSRALTTYRTEPKTWRQIMRAGMAQDWSWARSAKEYETLYERLRVSAI